MASIRKRGNSYQIRASAGYDINGKQITKTKTFRPPAGWSEKRIEKEVQRLAVEFENAVSAGQAFNGSMRLCDFVEKWMTEYVEKNLRPKTIARYKELLSRILPALGHKRLDQLKPLHIVEFYNNLSEEGIKISTVCRPVVDLKAELKKHGLSMSNLSKISGVSYSTVCNACRGANVKREGAKKIAESLRIPYIQLFEDVKAGDTLSTGTIAQHHRLLSTILKTAVQWGLMYENPCQRVEPPKAIHKKGVTLSVEDTLRLFAYLEDAPKKYKTAVTVLLYSGLRKGELFGLKWSDLEFSTGRMTISRAVEYLPVKGLFLSGPKTESGKRTIILPLPAVIALREYKKHQNQIRLAVGDRWEDTGFIFTKDDGTLMHPDSLANWFSNFVKANNLPHVTLHSLRHTNASLMIASGIDLATVSKRLGHADTSITARVYTHAIQEVDAQAAEALEHILLREKKG